MSAFDGVELAISGAFMVLSDSVYRYEDEMGVTTRIDVQVRPVTDDLLFDVRVWDATTQLIYANATGHNLLEAIQDCHTVLADNKNYHKRIKGIG